MRRPRHEALVQVPIIQPTAYESFPESPFRLSACVCGLETTTLPLTRLCPFSGLSNKTSNRYIYGNVKKHRSSVGHAQEDTAHEAHDRCLFAQHKDKTAWKSGARSEWTKASIRWDRTRLPLLEVVIRLACEHCAAPQGRSRLQRYNDEMI